MGLNEDIVVAITRLTPNILKAPYIDFFDLFLKEQSKEHNIDGKTALTFKNFFDEYHSHCLECCEYREWKNKKTELKKICKQMSQISDGIFWNYNQSSLTNIDWDGIREFAHFMKHCKRSDEHKVRWAIFHKFNSLPDNRIIAVLTVQDLETMLEGFEINIDRMIRKILKKKWVNVKIVYDGKQIIIDHKNDDPLIQKYIVDPLDYQTRSGVESNDDRILELLDEGAYTQTEVSKFLDLKKSAVSKIWKRLGEDDRDEIEFVNRGPKGVEYYTTNCDNCFLGKEKKTCRNEAITEMISIIKNNFGFKAPSESFEKIQSNQGLLKLRRVLREAERQKDNRIDENFKNVVFLMYQSLVQKFQTGNTKEGEYFVDMSSMLEKLPVLLQIGWHMGNASGASLSASLHEAIAKKVGIKPGMKLTKELLEKLEEIAVEESNRISSSVSSK